VTDGDVPNSPGEASEAGAALTQTNRRATQRAALDNHDLVRYTTAVLLNMIAKGGIFLGVLVYAFEHGGAEATGLSAIALHVPSVLLAPMLGALAERYRPHRVRIAAMALQTLSLSVTAFAAAADLATAFVVTAGTIGIVAATALGPAGAVLRPAIVRSSRELTVANLWTGYATSISVFAAPAMATLMLLLGGSTAVLAANAVFACVAGIVSVVGHPAEHFGGKHLGHGGILVCHRALVMLPRGLKCQHVRRRDFRCHVGDLEARTLELANGLTKLLTGRGPFGRHLEYPFGAPDRERSD
jgi:MFS family permease